MAYSFTLQIKNWTLEDRVIWPDLCRNIEDPDQMAFKQSFQRAWEPIELISELDALKLARRFAPDKHLVLDENRRWILIVTDDEAAQWLRIAVNYNDTSSG